MPAFEDWLRASWHDFLRRWPTLMAVIGLSGAATLAGVFLPLAVGALAVLVGVGPAWGVWGAAGTVALLAGLWLSTWAQAALLRAAQTEETVAECLTRSWKQTPAFAWVLSLVLLAVGGGCFLLLVPGLILSVLFAFAPFYQLSGEAAGLEALGISWGRVQARFLAVTGRVVAAGLIAAAPGWIPYLGWVLGPLWMPFGAVAVARLAADARVETPRAQAPVWLAAAVVALALVFTAGTAATSWSAYRTVRALAASGDFDAWKTFGQARGFGP